MTRDAEAPPSDQDVDGNVGHQLGALYTPRVDRAAALVLHDFRRVTRKGKRTPYFSHLFAVTALVAEGGGDEDQLVAALLHDWLEDVPGATGVEVERQFGARVRRIVEALSDSTTHPKPPWRARKEAYLTHLREMPPDVKLVSAADKLHNASSLVRDLELQGTATLSRFSGGAQGTLWYYATLLGALRHEWDHWLLTELEHAVGRMHALAGVPLGDARPPDDG